MQTLTAAPAASTPSAPPDLSTAGAAEAEGGGAEYVVLPMAEGPDDSPLTGREILQYVVMFVAGVLITVVTVWFYWLIQ